MTAERALDEGSIHDVLRNERRRHTLELLRENGDTLSVRDLSERVAALETGESPAPRNIRQSVYVSLHQTHLPKLDELGIVEYDADAKQVTLTDRVEDVEAYMGRPTDTDAGSDPRWARYTLVLSVLGIVTMLAVTLGVPVVTAIGAPTLGVVLFAVVFAVAIQQLQSNADAGSDSGPDVDPGSDADRSGR